MKRLAKKTTVDQKKIEDQKKIFAIEVAQEVLRLDKLNREKEEKKSLFRNTKILLKSYPKLISHCENGVWTDYQDENGYDIDLHLHEPLKEDIVIESIKRTKARTMMFIVWLESAMAKLERDCLANNTHIKYVAMQLMYLDEEYTCLPWLERKLKAAEKLNVSESTVNRYALDMIDELSLLLYGLGAMKLIN